MPIAATKHTTSGARAFGTFFIQTIDWGYATTSASYMRHYYEKSRIACRSIADAIDKAARAHHRFIGDRFTIRSTGRPSVTATGVRTAVHFDVNSAEVVDSNGDYVATLPAMLNFQEAVRTSWRKSTWTVTEMTPKA